MDFLELSSKYRIFLFRFKNSIKKILFRTGTNIIIGNHVRIDKNVVLRFGSNSNVFIGDYVYIGRGCKIECSPEAILSIDQNVNLAGYDFISCFTSLKIGANTQIGEFTSIRDSNHNYINVKETIESQGYNKAKIVISDDVWIGRGCTVLKGLSIGRHTVIGANSVVNKDIPSYSVAVGSPAKVIKYFNFEIEEWSTLKLGKDNND